MKKFIFIYLLISFHFCFSQKEANIWYFGKNAGIDFNSGTPTSLTNGQLNTQEGCSTISDINGNLLFYSDGINVWTQSGKLMTYSDGRLANDLKGNPSSSQSGLIVPNPENKNIYYIFTVGTDLTGSNSNLPINPGLNYYTVDISKGVEGEIISGPVNLSDNRDSDWSEKVTAVQANSCNEIWVVSIVQNTFYAYKIDKDGVITTTPQKSLSSYDLKDKRGYLKISPDGSKLALADFSSDSKGRLVLYDFDNTTGKVISNGIILTNGPVDGAPYGVEFSQQSSKLYTSVLQGQGDFETFVIFQYDLLAPDITQSKTEIWSEAGYRGALQLGPNGKIYASIPDKNFLGVIENPDEASNQVVFTSNAIPLNGKTTTQGLPPFIQSFFAPVKLINLNTGEILNNTNQILCNGDSYDIQPELNDPSNSYTWFKDGKEIANTSKISISDTNFGSGLYEVKIETFSGCKKTYTGKVQITFVTKPIINDVPTYIQCDFDTNPIDGFTIFNLETIIPSITNNSNDINIDFFETNDILFQNPINKSSYINTTSNNHSIVVKVTNILTKCFQTKLINLQVNSTGLTSYSNEYFCELDKNSGIPSAKFSIGSGNGTFDFAQKTKKIIQNSGNTLSEDTHNFEYFFNSEDASLQVNQILPPYTNYLFTNNSEIFIRISNKELNSCESVGSFKIFIEEIPAPQGNLDESILCIDNPKRNPQPRTIQLDADTGNSSDTYKWYLDGVLMPEETNAIHNANSAGEYKVEAYRVHPNISSPCVGYNTFYVKESNKALIVSIKSFDNNDNPENNKIEIIVEGIGDYEYALNSTNLGDFIKGEENLTFTFTNIPPGLNSISIRDRNGCGIVSSEQISTIYFQRFFTPNGDPYNNTWNILGVNNDFYQSVNVQIFNRYGKLIKTITDKNDPGWNGVYNGNILPSNDYWYNAELLDINGKFRKKSGHFSLLRK